MPRTQKRKLMEFKNKVKKKMRRLERMMDTFTSNSDSDDSAETSTTSATSNDQDSGKEATELAQRHLPEIDAQNREENPDDPLETLLGSYPANTTTEGPEIAADLAKRWEAYLSCGLDKDTRKTLIEQWNVPKNCKYLSPPVINPEVQPLLSAADLKKDRFQQNLQEILGKGIAAQGTALTKILEKRDTIDAPITQALVDSSKLLTDIFHTLSTHRKYHIQKYFNEPIQKIAAKQNVDSCLLGSDFSEKCKMAKTVETAALELQKPCTSNQTQPSTSKNLNYQRQNYKKRMKTEERKGTSRASPYKHLKRVSMDHRKEMKPHVKYRNNNRHY